MDQKSDAKVMPKTKRVGKTDVRYWAGTIFRRKRGGGEDTDWTAQVQFLKRREQFPLGTPNKAAAAAKARDIYLSLQARGWDDNRLPRPLYLAPLRRLYNTLRKEYPEELGRHTARRVLADEHTRQLGAEMDRQKTIMKTEAARTRHGG